MTDGKNKGRQRHAGTDPLRAVRLMWEPPEPAKLGRKPSLSLDKIVTTAVELADEHGIDALTMRTVAAGLGAGTMTLYNYVANKSDLLEVMVDRVHAEIVRPDANAPWRDQVVDLARQIWRLYHRHPWILQTNQSRLSLGPKVIDSAEYLFAALEGSGLGAVDLAHSATLFSNYLHGAARNSVLEAQAVAETGISIGQYYEARGEFWERYFDVDRYPAHTRIWNAGGFDDETVDPFIYGLERLLDGLARQ